MYMPSNKNKCLVVTLNEEISQEIPGTSRNILLMVQKSGVANQLIRYISHYLQGILYIPRCCTISSINSISRIPMLKLQPHRFLQVVHAGATTVYPCCTTWPRRGGVSCKEDKHCALQLQDQHQQHQEQQEHQQD